MGYTPEWRAFVQLNLGGSGLSDLQRSYVDNKELDYIVTEKELCDAADYEQKANNCIEIFEDFGYELIDEASFEYEEDIHWVRLYRRLEGTYAKVEFR